MYLAGFDGNWLANPFWTSRFMLAHADELRLARASVLAECWIDTHLGADVAPVADADAGIIASDHAPEQNGAGRINQRFPNSTNYQESIPERNYRLSNFSQTRREHFQELRAYLGLSAFGLADFRKLAHSLVDLATQTDKGLVLAAHALETLRQRHIILPTLAVIERVCAEAVTRVNRRIYRALLEPLQPHHKRGLDNLLNVAPDTNITWLMWLRQSPLKPNSRHMREHIERLNILQSLALPDGTGRQIHQNRLLKMAREGAQMQPYDLAKFEDERRYATLVALAIEGMATVIDELIDLHDRIMVKVFSAAKNKHQEQFQKQGKAINDKVLLYSKVGRALVAAKESGADPYAAIEAVIPWAAFAQSVTDAAELAQPATFDHLHLVGDHHSMLRRYTPELLDVFRLNAAPAAQAVLDAIEIVRCRRRAACPLRAMLAWPGQGTRYSTAL